MSILDEPVTNITKNYEALDDTYATDAQRAKLEELIEEYTFNEEYRQVLIDKIDTLTIPEANLMIKKLISRKRERMGKDWVGRGSPSDPNDTTLEDWLKVGHQWKRKDELK